jgi:cation diffusion facilitator CzcD-associated flavoprotein CzcO
MSPTTSAPSVDVLIVGAGLSGIGAACRLRISCPSTSFAVLESRAASGGTWDLFRYPGVRSDSDMFTLGYPFRPWVGTTALAGGPEILRYVRETAAAYGVDERIEYGVRVVGARWSSADSRWIVTVRDEASGAETTRSARSLYLCTGYYRYDEGYTPEFAGLADFGGTVVHPQQWPDALDVRGKRVVVVGSGATAVTLVPALTAEGAEVTMLQRSPSYVFSLPAHDPIAAEDAAAHGRARAHGRRRAPAGRPDGPRAVHRDDLGLLRTIPRTVAAPGRAGAVAAAPALPERRPAAAQPGRGRRAAPELTVRTAPRTPHPAPAPRTREGRTTHP